MTTTRACKPAADYRTRAPRADGWTAERQAMFLFAIAQSGMVSHACTMAEMSAAAAYGLRRQRRGIAFNLGWRAAALLARDVVEDGLLEAAIDGVKSVSERYEGATHRRALNPRLSMAVLNRLDARAAALDDSEAAVARSIGAAFEEFIAKVILAGGGEADLAAFLAAHPDPLAVQVAAHRREPPAAEAASAPQLVEESAIFEDTPARSRQMTNPIATPAIAMEPCTCFADRDAVLLEPV